MERCDHASSVGLSGQQEAVDVGRERAKRVMAATKEKRKSSPARDEVVDDFEQEKQHFQDVLKAFAFYKRHVQRRIDQADNWFKNLSKAHQEMVPDFSLRQQALENAVDTNWQFITLMLHNARCMFVNSSVTDEVPSVEGDDPAIESAAPGQRKVSVPSWFTMEKVLTTLKQFYRDWSVEGQSERDSCYTPLIEELQKHFPTPTRSGEKVKVLVPGAGLGRLAFEIARLGYECQGNEFSMHMLIASNFMLNRLSGNKQLTIFPWIQQYCNNLTTADQLQPISVPDVNPHELPSDSNFSMAAGDFLEVYDEPNQWDCVVTCFFIDTAHNPMAYVECIMKILKPGGLWINLGPLLWHFADVPNELSVELSYEQLRRVIVNNFKFNMLTERHSVPCTYLQNPNSMLKNMYDCIFFVCCKPGGNNK